MRRRAWNELPATPAREGESGAIRSLRRSVGRSLLPGVLTVVTPLARRWVDAQQTRILRDGVPLTPLQAADAKLAGVRDVSRVRLMSVERVPTPLDFMLRHVERVAWFVSGSTLGITFGHGIYLRADLWSDRALLVHELVHVGQYERYGSTETFLHDYLEECLTFGYPNGPLEQEALLGAAAICRDFGGERVGINRIDIAAQQAPAARLSGQ